MHSSSARQYVKFWVGFFYFLFWSSSGKSKVCVISCQNTAKQKSQIFFASTVNATSIVQFSLPCKSKTAFLSCCCLIIVKRRAIFLSGSNSCFVVYLTRCTSNKKYFLHVSKNMLFGSEINKTTLKLAKTLCCFFRI